MNKCPKCRRPKAEGAKFCRACYAVFAAPGGFTAISRHNREARIASILMQLFILFLASMAVWLIQADLSFLRAAKERLGQSIAEAEQGARSWIDGRSSSNPLPDDNGSKKAAGIEGSDQRCEGSCPEQPSATAARAPRKLVVSVDTSGMATGREAAEIMISGMDVCPAGRVCQGIVSFEAGTVGKYTMIGTSPSSTTLIPADRYALALFRKFSHGTLEVRLGGGRIRTVPIYKQKKGKWTTDNRVRSGSSTR